MQYTCRQPLEDDVQIEVGLKKAIHWISEERRADPQAGLGKLIEEACRRFDLSPLQCDFLYRHFLQPAAKRQEEA